MWIMTCRVIASIVTFLVGWTVFAIVRPSEEIQRLPQPARYISAITLKRLGCSDAERKCPVFEATYRSDGTCTYIGYANDDYIGDYKGTYNSYDFTYMVDQLNKQEFFELPLEFSASSTQETTTVEVIASDGVHAVTTYNWLSTPSGLRALQALIEQQAYEAEWEKVE
ncbi:MAG TPA: DUF6438 domain-containing protein [Pyrinomonadaceae bacterium]|nr:DUF6438 domain-containing protein [Pyrinomonadaceae bacterium]